MRCGSWLRSLAGWCCSRLRSLLGWRPAPPSARAVGARMASHVQWLVRPEGLRQEMVDAVEVLGQRCYAHRYRVPIIVTSAFRAGDKGQHGKGWAVDIRGRLPAWDTPALQLKLRLWIAAMWVDVLRDMGYEAGEWGIGCYDWESDDGHIHLDIRQLPVIKAAVWVGRD